MGSQDGVKWTMLGPQKMFRSCHNCDPDTALDKFELMNYSHIISHEFILLSDRSVLQCYFSAAPFWCESELARTSDRFEVRNQAIFNARRKKGEIIRNQEKGRRALGRYACMCAYTSVCDVCMYVGRYVCRSVGMYVCMYVCRSVCDARRLHFLTKTTSETKQSLIFECQEIKDKRLMRHFLPKWQVECRADTLVSMRFVIFSTENCYQFIRSVAPVTQKKSEQVCISDTPKCKPPQVVWAPSVLRILARECSSRHNGMQFCISHLATWLRARHYSESTFRPSGALDHWVRFVVRNVFFPFLASASSFSWLFLFDSSFF